MIILDSLLAGGIGFVLDKLAAAVDSEMSGEKAEANLRESLLAAEMQLELGEIDEEEFAALEREILSRLRELRQGERADQGALSFAGGGLDLDVEVSFDSRPPAGGAKDRGAEPPAPAPAQATPTTFATRADQMPAAPAAPKTAEGKGEESGAAVPPRRSRAAARRGARGAKSARAPRNRPAGPPAARS